MDKKHWDHMTIFQNILFYVPQKKKVLQVWNDMSKLRQNLNFWQVESTHYYKELIIIMIMHIQYDFSIVCHA